MTTHSDNSTCYNNLTKEEPQAARVKRKQGKRARIQARLNTIPNRPALILILLSNVRSL